MGVDLLSMVEFKNKDQAEKVQEDYRKQAEDYKKEQAEISDKAKEFEGESAHAQHKADRFDLGEVFLEDLSGDFFSCAAVWQAFLLVSRDRFGSCRVGRRGDRALFALNPIGNNVTGPEGSVQDVKL